MRAYHILLSVALVLIGAALTAAAEPNIGELTRELTGEKPAAQRTAEQLGAVYAQVLDSMMPDMGSEDPGRRGGPQGTLERIAFHASRPGAEAERVACSKAIAARLGPGPERLARLWLLRQLERIGGQEAASQVARLLADQDPLVREAARRALQKNRAECADILLRQAIDSARDLPWRVALINALAERRRPSNLSSLLKEAAADNEDVRTAAVRGLGKLGDRRAAEAIAAAMRKGTPRAKAIATEANLRLAEALAAKGNKANALEIYKGMLSLDGHWKCAALIGVGRSGTSSDLPILFDALGDPDVRVRGACVEAMCLLPGGDVTGAIAAKVNGAKPEAKLALLQTLARRGDKGTAPVFIAAAEDADEAVQVAALAGLGTVGNPSATAILLKAAASSGKPQEAARQSLQSLPGADIDHAVLRALDEKDAKIRIEAIRALAARHVVAATAPLLATARSSDAQVRNEALKAIGTVAPTLALSAVCGLLLEAEDDGTRNEAAAALVKIANRERDIEGRSEPVLKALGSARGPANLALLGVLGRIGGQRSLEGVRAAVKDNDEKVRDAAIRALAEWPDALAAGDLLALAKTAPSETHQVIALRGYLRVCSIRSDRPQAETARMLVAGLETARRPDEKRQALGHLAEVRDIVALRAVAPCLDQDTLKEEAASAAVRIGRDIWHGNPEAVQAAMQKVLQVSKNDNLKREAQEVLNRAEQRLKENKPKK